MKCVFHALHWMKYFILYPRFNINVNCFLKLSYKNKWKKARIHCEIFLSDCFMKHSLMNISIVYKKTDEWYIELQRVTTNDKEWQRVVRVTTNDNEWQWVVQRVTTSGTTRDNEWQRVTTSCATSDKSDNE